MLAVIAGIIGNGITILGFRNRPLPRQELDVNIKTRVVESLANDPQLLLPTSAAQILYKAANPAVVITTAFTLRGQGGKAQKYHREKR